MSEEIWKDIKGYEGLYQISSFGKVMSINYNHTNKSKLLKPKLTHNGYYQYNLSKNGHIKGFKAHRLVAYAFLPPQPDETYQINHKNECKIDNRIENLEWVTPKENSNYGTRTERIQKTLNERGTRVTGTHKKAVIIYKNNNIIGEFSSIKDAASALGFSCNTISHWASGKVISRNGYCAQYK